jgi:predicted membrane chloride channel (bestrophin family)
MSLALSESTPLVGVPPSEMEGGLLFAHFPSNNKPSLSRQQSTFEGIPHKREVEYDGDNHLSVLLQMYGSVWPKVFPWCIATMLVSYGIILLRDFDIVDLTIHNNNGHSFMSILVSFLVVTRATITYNRFMQARQYLSELYRSSREVVQYACLLSNADKGTAAQRWRQDVAYRTILTLRMATVAVEFQSHGINAWDALPEEDHERTELSIKSNTAHGDGNKFGTSIAKNQSVTDHSGILSDLMHGPRTLTEENFRAPHIWAYNLREKLLEHRNGNILVHHPLHVSEDLALLALVSQFVTGFHGLKKLITTPFPFPLVQMTRTFLFFWVFSLPSVLINDNDKAIEVLILMFFCTYGFLGLEYVSMELDDPYGRDPNDFPGQ